MSKKWFPIMGGPAIPWSKLEPHYHQVWRNHAATLKRLAERGGLSPYEACCAIEGRGLYHNNDIPANGTASEPFYLTRLANHVDKDKDVIIARLTANITDLEERPDLSYAVLQTIAKYVGLVERPLDEIEKAIVARLEATQVMSLAIDQFQLLDNIANVEGVWDDLPDDCAQHLTAMREVIDQARKEVAADEN